MSFLRWLKRNVDRVFFAALRQVLRRRHRGDSGPVVIVRTDGIGDLVFFLQYLPSLRSAFPNRTLVLVCRPDPAQLVGSLSSFDHVIEYRYMSYRRNYLYRLLVLSRIRMLKATTALYASYHREHIGDEMTLLSGATTTIAFSGNDEVIHPGTLKRNSRLYQQVLDAPDHGRESDRYAALLKLLGAKEARGEVGIESRFKRALAGTLHGSPARAPRPDGKYCVVSPGGSAGIRRWPEDGFVQVADWIAARGGYRIVLCGGRSERALLEAIRARMKHPVELIFDLPLRSVAEVIGNASFFVGNESGLLHIAATLGVPAVGIMGGGHFSRYFPYGSARIVSHQLACFECNWRCPFPEPYCLTHITVGQVLEIIESVANGDQQR